MQLIRRFILITIFIFSLKGTSQSYIPVNENEKLMKIKSSSITAYPFSFEEVQLKESVFKKALEADVAYLKRLDPDRFLSQFRTNAGLEAKNEKYGGWENDGLAGHSLGHYLSACSIHYANTKDPFFLDRINYIVDELAECQKARGTGYVGAIPNEDLIFYKVALGKIDTGGFSLNGGWAPWYTIHKIMAGLIDAYLYSGNEKALEVNLAIADWTEKVLKCLSEEQIQTMLRCEYGGMNEVLVNTYAITGNQKYLELSYKFFDDFVGKPLQSKIDPLPGKHSNTNIPKAIASIRNFELTADEKKETAASFLWDIVVGHHTYAPGGNGNYEYFGEGDHLNDALTDNTMETCATYNMLKLTAHLFAINPSSHYMDYYERALYNHILASQNRADGMSTYFLPLRMGAKKGFSDDFHTFTCCVGTTMENHVRYGESIFSHDNDGGLYLNLFIPSELNWKERKLKVQLNTEFPKDEKVSLTIQTSKKQEFPIKIRKPYWLTDAMTLKINGKTAQYKESDVDGYIEISRKWSNNDVVEISLPMGIHQMAIPDNKDRLAFLYGPVVLAGDLGTIEPAPAATPVFVTDKTSPKEWIKAEDLSSLRFTTVSTGQPNEVSFKPLYQFTDNYYSVYWDVFTPQSWEVQKQKYEEEKIAERNLADRTVSIFRVGEMQPERDHNFEGVNSQTGTDHTRNFRVSGNDEPMSFTMEVDPELKNSIILTYWGMDNRYRRFSILIDGTEVGKEDLNKFKNNQFYDISYDIPTEVTIGKKIVTVTLKPEYKNEAGPIYGVRMVKEKP